MEPGPRPWRTALIFPIDISCSPHFPALFLLEKAPLAAALFSPPPSVHFSTYTPAIKNKRKKKSTRERRERERRREREEKKREGGRDATRQNRTETETRPPQRGRTPLNGTDRAREKGRKGEREKGRKAQCKDHL